MPRRVRKMGHRRPRGAKLNKRQKREIKQMISNKVEVKHFDQATAYAQIDYAGQMSQLTLIPQGAAQQQRTGDEVQLKSIEINFTSYYFNVFGVIDNAHNWRMIVFRWNVDSSIGVPSVGSILAAGANVNAVNAPYDWNALKQKDFHVILDKRFSVGATDKCQNKHLKKNLKGHKLVFDPATTAGAGHIYMLLIGDDVTGAHTPDVQVQWQSRITYVDA